MTTNTVKQLVSPTALSATPTTTLYTVPAGTKTIIKEILLTNTDSIDRTVTLYIGNGSTTANTLLSTTPIVPGGNLILTLSTVLIASDTIKGGASSASVVSCTISGVEVV